MGSQNWITGRAWLRRALGFASLVVALQGAGALLIQARALADFDFPELETEEQIARWKERILAVAPWLSNGYVWSGNGASHYFDNTPKVMKAFKEHATFADLAKLRKDPILIRLSTRKLESRDTLMPKPEVFTRWREETLEILVGLNGLDSADAATLQQARAELQKTIRETLANLTTDPRGIVTGLVNSLPGPERGAIFRLGSPLEQLAALEAHPALTEEAVQANFRPQSVGLEPTDVSRAFLIPFARSFLLAEARLARNLRALVYLQSFVPASPDQRVDVLDVLRSTPANADPAETIKLDAFSPEHAESLKPLSLGGAIVDPRGALPKLAKASYAKSDYEVRSAKVWVAGDSYTVEETPADVAGTRGFLMKDCSTGGFGYGYIPTEYAFLIRKGDGTPLSFIVATAVDSTPDTALVGVDHSPVRTLFVHDVGGIGDSEAVNFALHALNESLPRLGFKRMTVNHDNGNVGGYRSVVSQRRGSLWKEKVKQTYLDAEIREYFKKLVTYAPSYDSSTNANNLRSYVFVPDDGIEKQLSSTAERIQFYAANAPSLARSPREAVIAAIELLHANPEMGITDEMRAIPGIRVEDVIELLDELKNLAGDPLATYYERVGKLFGALGIELSGKFIKQYDFLFWAGHLRAPDAVTSSDAPRVNASVTYAIRLLKGAKKPVETLLLIGRHFAFFRDHEKFQTYLRSFTGRGASEAARLAELRELGFDFGYLAQQPEALKLLSESDVPATREWARKLLEHSCASVILNDAA